VPILYGTTEPKRFSESAVNILYEKVAKGESFSIDNVQVRYPTHCVDVARFLFLLLTKRFEVTCFMWISSSIECLIGLFFKTKSEEFEGILHCSALDQYTKYTMSLIIAERMGLSKEHIHPDDSAAMQTVPANCTRPQNAQLDTKFTFELLDFKPIMNFSEQIKDCLENFA
jgi:dTDP-4-dehydrorhamnose reductase